MLRRMTVKHINVAVMKDGKWTAGRFKDFPFHYRETFKPLDLSEEPTVCDIHDDFADIYGDLWHGLKALELGDGVYAIEH